MKAFKLLKICTDEKVLRLLIFTLSFSALDVYADEVADSLAVAEFNSCTQNEGEIQRIQRELNSACREAGLGSSSACIQTMHDCEQDDADENDQCLNHMTTEDDVERNREDVEALREQQSALQDKIKEEQSLIVSLEQEAIEINKAKTVARANLAAALAEIGTQRSQTQAKLNADLEQLEIAVDQAKDQLVTNSLAFEEFVLSKVDECDATANQYNTQTYANYVNRAQRGVAKYSQASLFSMTGLSVRELVRNKANVEMKRCMAKRTRTVHGTILTPYGRRYALERKKIRAQEKVIEREIDRMQKKRVELRSAHKLTLASINQAEAAQLSTSQNEVLNLNKQGQVLIAREQAALKNIDQYQLESLALMLVIKDAENKLNSSHGEGIKVASDDEMEAYREAQQAADSLKQAAESAQFAVDRCNNQNYISSILEMFDNDRGDSGRGVASPGEEEAILLATPVEGSGPDDAPRRPPTGDNSDVRVTPGSQTI